MGIHCDMGTSQYGDTAIWGHCNMGGVTATYGGGGHIEMWGQRHMGVHCDKGTSRYGGGDIEMWRQRHMGVQCDMGTLRYGGGHRDMGGGTSRYGGSAIWGHCDGGGQRHIWGRDIEMWGQRHMGVQ